MTEKRRRALMIVGHGSHLHADSAAPVYAHAATLRGHCLVDEVVPAFWKEEPSLREALRAINASEVVIVPLFISSGYFTEQVIPRELGLDRPDPNRLSVVDGKSVVYTGPIGTHPRMTDVVVHRARKVVGDERLDPDQTALVIVGHGTPRNGNSAQAIYHQVERLKQCGLYGEVLPLFIDEEPHIDHLFDICHAPNIIVVPYFVSEGLHTQEDIPEILGITYNGQYSVPAEARGRRLWYTRTVGTDPAVVEVIRERARAGLTLLDVAKGTGEVPPVAAVAHRAFADWAREQPRRFGQLLISPLTNGRWDLRHVADAGCDHLKQYTDPFTAERLARFDERARYRPLSTAPTLVRGWMFHLRDDRALRQALDVFYPAAVVTWYDERVGQLCPTPFSESAARQSGMYAPVKHATVEQTQRAIQACCTDDLCLKHITWDIEPGRPAGESRSGGDIPCREACGILIGLVRQIVLSERQPLRQLALSSAEMETLEAIVEGTLHDTFEPAREGETGDPANIRRIRLLAQSLRSTACDTPAE